MVQKKKKKKLFHGQERGPRRKITENHECTCFPEPPLGACLFLEVVFHMSTPRTSALVLSGSP
ncbi:hypothetical protein ACRRTK_008568 [Alexandromys fortis]